MTVWIENPFDNLPEEGFRPQRYHLMAEAFLRAGYRVVLWTSDFNHTTKRKRQLIAPPRTALELRLLPTPPYSRNVSLRRLYSHHAYTANWLQRARQALAAGERPALIIASLPTIGSATAAASLAAATSARLVIDLMDEWPETFLRLFPRPLRPLAYQLLRPLASQSARAIAAADLVTGVADRYAAKAHRAGQTEFFRCYHGIQLNPPPPPRTSTDLRLVYAGNLGRSYDLGTVLDALALLPDARLDIAGRGELEPEWQRRAAELKLSERVRFHGYLDADQLEKLLGECHLGIVPMRSESCVGIPYKFADYAAAGLGILSSLGGESATLLQRYRCGGEYADAASLVAAIMALQSELPELPKRARQLAESEFDAVRLYDEYVIRAAGENGRRV